MSSIFSSDIFAMTSFSLIHFYSGGPSRELLCDALPKSITLSWIGSRVNESFLRNFLLPFFFGAGIDGMAPLLC